MLLSAVAVCAQVGVFFGAPYLHGTWPRGWLVIYLTMFAALAGGWVPGLAAHATGLGLILVYGRFFTPTHPGIEVFALLGATLVVMADRLRREHRDNVRLMREVRAASEAKDQFLATLSHELRTPLNVVLGQSRLLPMRASDPAAVIRTSQILERNAKTQLRMVEDLLDIQRILRGGLIVERDTFDLTALAESVRDSLSAPIAAKRLHVGWTFDEVEVVGDRERIQQVVWNLLSNAVKYTPEDGCIGIHGKRLDARSVTLRIEDSGEGIPPEFLPFVFEPFRQADMSTTRRHGGLGLGLAIVKHIVEAHQGTVDVESRLGVGTTFTVTLPIRPA